MAILSPRTTGLPLTAGEMDIDSVAVISIRPEPWLVTGALDSATFEQITGWIRHNEAALLDDWDDVIDTAELIGKLQKRAA